MGITNQERKDYETANKTMQNFKTKQRYFFDVRITYGCFVDDWL